MNDTEISIRPLAESELPILIERFTDPDFAIAGQFDRRFQAQQLGQSVYLMAWVAEELAGNLYLRWRPSDPNIAARLPNYAHAGGLAVLPPFQRRGVATALLVDAEYRARERGCDGIGLQVAIDNEPARRLYDGRGYRDSGFAPPRCGTHFHDRSGLTHRHEDICVYLVKRLAGSGFD